MSKNKSDVLSDIMTLTDLSVMTRLIRAGLRSVLSLICGYVSPLVTSHFRIGLQLTWRHNTFLVYLSLGNKLVVYIVLY